MKKTRKGRDFVLISFCKCVVSQNSSKQKFENFLKSGAKRKSICCFLTLFLLFLFFLFIFLFLLFHSCRFCCRTFSSCLFCFFLFLLFLLLFFFLLFFSWLVLLLEYFPIPLFFFFWFLVHQQLVDMFLVG